MGLAFISTLIEWDKQLFLKINSWHHPLLDDAMMFISHRFTWVPLYLLLGYIIVQRFKKKSWLIFINITLLIAASDRISSGFFKPYFERLRPCHEVALQPSIHLVNGCGGTYGFVSSHAANCFAIALFMILLLPSIKSLRLLLPWAFLVAYSRIYLGVHYPGDVFFGGLLGLCSAYVIFLICRKSYAVIFREELIIQKN